MNRSIRVALVDDQSLLRKAFALMLSVEDDIELVGEAGDGREAIGLAQETRPDIILMDIQRPGLDGLQATRAIVGAGYAQVIVLTIMSAVLLATVIGLERLVCPWNKPTEGTTTL